MKYLTRILSIAFQRSLVRTDVIAAVLTALAPITYKVMGAKMPEDFALQISLLVAGLVGAVMILRLVAAPYLVWREDQNTITELQERIDAPHRARKVFFEDRFLSDRAQLAKDMAKFVASRLDAAQFAERDPDKVLDVLVENAVHFLGDARFQNYWDVFCSAFRNVIMGATTHTKLSEEVSAERLSLINERLKYDHSAMKVAALSLVYILRENDDHAATFTDGLANLAEQYKGVTQQGHPNTLWILPASETPQNTPS